MCQLGNARVNAIYEYEIPSHVKKPTIESSRASRETFVRLKYAQHAFVHPHPNFERPDIPLPPPTIAELLTPSKSPLTLRKPIGSPKSPTRRSFSPSFLRSPRLQKGLPHSAFKSSSRPSSASFSKNTSDYSTPADSVEDLSQIGESGSLEMLAHNLKKLEKSGKLKSWGGSQKLGEKIRSTARRSSKRISAYAKNKLNEARDKLRPKERAVISREVHSDVDDEEMTTTSTPLLYSMSASTHNLSSTYSSPPPKPPRTFATKHLSSASLSDEDSDLLKDSGDFSDILSAIKEMGVLYKSTSSLEELDSETAVIPNGLIHESGSSKIKKSESSPQLSHNKLSKTDEPATIKSKGNSPRLTPLNTIDENLSSRQEQSSDNLIVSNTSIDLALGVVESPPKDKYNEERLFSSVPLRRKKLLAASTSFDTGTFALADNDSEVPASETTTFDESKRFSILSTTSADFFSADSSEASDSKLPSVSVSPEIPPDTPSGPDHLRVPSSCSADECFSTPPSTPTLPTSKHSTLNRDEQQTNQIEDVDQDTKTVNREINNEAENNQNTVQSQVTANRIMTTSQTPKLTPGNRKRSLTVSDSTPPHTHTKRPVPYTVIALSKYDNFNTEYKAQYIGKGQLVSSFSQQDMVEILGNEQVKIDPAVGQALAIPEDIEEEGVVSLEGKTSSGTEGAEVMSSVSAVPCDGGSHVEVVIIPDDITPSQVTINIMCQCKSSLCLCMLLYIQMASLV